jgi:GntR family transcriptional regulator/MocR family aminotransferase
MTKPSGEFPLVLERKTGKPLQSAVYDAIREAILGGRVAVGARLPATRDLSEQLGVARGTVVSAYEQLTLEGYLCGKRGAGTFVSETLPDEWLLPRQRAAHSRRPRKASLSARGAALARARFPMAVPGAPRPFLPYTPAVDVFPRARWGQLVARHARLTHPTRFRDLDARGYAPLREALAEHLRAFRGMRCGAGQVLILPGVHQALDLVARLLLDPGEAAWIEDPGYFGARRVLEAADVELAPVPVDDAGLDVVRGIAVAPHARLAYVTPAHQAPRGSTLSLDRRMRLLDWADREGAWIFEDDYDSEFRYEGKPLAALQSLDHRDVVIHAGTLSKVMFPGLRLSYLVVPDALVDPFTAAMSVLHRYVPLVLQAAAAEFIAEGDLGRHIRRARNVYAERRTSLVSALTSELGHELHVAGTTCGMQVLARLVRSISDRAVCRSAHDAGLEILPLSKFAIRPLRRGGLVMGFAAVESARTRRAVPLLRELLASMR